MVVWGFEMNATWLLTLLARVRADRAGPPARDVSVYQCRARLLTTTTVDAGTAVVARATARAGEDLEPVCEAWAARTPNPVTRASSRAEGRRLLSAAAEEVPRLRARVAPLPLPVAAGLVAAELGLDADDLARLVGYDDLQATLAGTGPADAHVWTQALLPDIRSMAAQVARITDPTRIPATGAALLAVASR